MFLNQLSEREKKVFLELTVHVSNSNGVFADEEKAMIQEYCKEMEIKEFNMDNIVPLEEIIGEIKKSSLHIKKIILLEILGLVYADGTYDADEKSFVLNFVKEIGLSDETAEAQTVVIKEYLNVLQKITEAIE